MTAAPLAETLASFQTLLASRGVQVSSLRAREDGTLGASSPTLLAEGEKAEPSAIVLAREELVPSTLLGRGGMGEVRLALQRSLRREVAIKTVLERQDALSQAALLKEAWAGGALEHPSVVPIHTLAQLDGEAAVVMKRIAGVSWAEILAMPEEHPRFMGAGALEAHLRVFVQVCHAMDFAHERGILHLDLKPENVMIGDLGEVYVLDWGLAASIEGGPAWLPPGKDMSLPAGTPGYMAPELAAAIHDRIGTRTDVYLLGALLHHVVTGRMRHEGDNLFHTLFRAYTDDPPAYGPEVPKRLAAILTRAMQRENDARFESARALREAVEAFLQHREAEHYLERAQETLSKIDARLGAPTKGDAETESLLAEAEVALFQVRRTWAAHPELKAVERGLVERRIAHAVAESRLDAARDLARELDPLPPALAASISALEARIAARARYERGLEEMERELDFSFGTAARRGLFGVLGLLWALCSVILGLVHRSGVMAFGYRELFVESVLLALVLGPFAWLARGRYLANRANRRLWGGLSFLALAVELFFASCALAGIGVDQAIAMTPVIYAFGFATLGIALDRRLLLGAPPLLVSAFVASAVPRYALDLVGVGGGLAVVLVLWSWRGGGERKSVVPDGPARARISQECSPRRSRTGAGIARGRQRPERASRSVQPRVLAPEVANGSGHRPRTAATGAGEPFRSAKSARPGGRERERASPRTAATGAGEPFRSAKSARPGGRERERASPADGSDRSGRAVPFSQECSPRRSRTGAGIARGRQRPERASRSVQPRVLAPEVANGSGHRPRTAATGAGEPFRDQSASLMLFFASMSLKPFLSFDFMKASDGST